MQEKQLMDDELKFCPFCGGNAVVWEHLIEKRWSVSCNDCLAETGDFVYKTKKEAIEAWNRRVAD